MPQAEIDLEKIRENVRRVRALCGVRVLVMVKADAYGHGMTEVARALHGEADIFGVATLEEGIELRRRGVREPVLVAVCRGADLPVCAAYGLTAAIADGEALKALASLPCGMRPSFHVKFDTGMHRLGFPWEDAGAVLSFLRSNALDPDGAYSHFRAPNEVQNARFANVARLFKAEYPNVLAHMASSSSLGMTDARYDMVRIGRAAYEGAMTVRSKVVAVRHARRGDNVGYGDFLLADDATVAVVFGGYYDGMRAGAPVILGGKERPVIGSVCMDMFAVDAGDAPVAIGDEVILLGGGLTEERVAKERGVSVHEVMTAWQGRCERSYVDERGSEKSGECRRSRDERRGTGVGFGSDNRRSHLP